MAHITDDPGNFSNPKPYLGSDSIMVGNGEQLPITHIGNAHLFPKESQLTLHNVICVLVIKKNLLFISQLTCDYPCYVLFNESGFLVKDQKTH